MRYPAYSEYKESGVQWLGQVPGHWDVKRSDGIISSDRNQVQPDSFKDEEVFHYSIPVVQEYGTGIVEDGESIASAKQVITEKCLLVSKLNPRKATICIAEPNEKRTLCSTEFVVLRARKCQLSFLTYFTQTELFRQGLDSKVQSVTRSHQRAAPDDIYKFWAAWPPLPEQTAIADFLDRETGRIDTLVAKKRRLIALLKEKRTALISRTVTRGLPADAAREFGLEPHTRFKDSGIEWLGQVPEGWVIVKFSREVKIAEGQVDPEREPYSSMVLIGPEHVEAGTGLLISEATAEDQAAISGKYYCHEGDVIYSKIRPALRKVVKAKSDCLCSADMYPLRGTDKLLNDYIYWLFLSDQFAAWSVLEADRVAMPKINRSTLNELRLPVPPTPEQTAIAAYLDRETAKIDRLTEKVDAAIARLQEYRTALITAAVTGKIDVREAVA